MKVLAQKNIKITFFAVFLTNLFVLITNLVKQMSFTEVKTLLIKLLKQLLKSMNTVKNVMKKHFNKNLVMAEKEEEQFQSSSICWICEKLNEDEKVRDHCHITGTFRGASHWNCNIIPQLTKKVAFIFHNLIAYDSHLIFYELKKVDVIIDVIPNRLEKYVTFILNKNLVFIGSM